MRVELDEHAGPEPEISLYGPVDHSVHDVFDCPWSVPDNVGAKAILDRILVAEEVRVADADGSLEPRAPASLELIKHVADFDEVALRVSAHLLRVCVELLPN